MLQLMRDCGDDRAPRSAAPDEHAPVLRPVRATEHVMHECPVSPAFIVGCHSM